MRWGNTNHLMRNFIIFSTERFLTDLARKKKNLPLITCVFLTQPGFHVKITLSSQTYDGMAVIFGTVLLPLARYF